MAAVLSLQSIAAAQRSAESHPALGDMVLGDRRVVEEIARAEGDYPIEPLLSRVHQPEHGGRGQKLERAAHRKALIGPTLETEAGPRIEDRDPEAPALAVLDRGEPLPREFQAILRRRSGRQRAERHRGRRQRDEDGTTAAGSHCIAPK